MQAFKEIVVFTLLVVSVLGEGQLNILHSPNGINFNGHQPLKTNELPEVFLAAMGRTVSSNDDWDGLSVVNPFNYPKTAVFVVFEGLSSHLLEGHTYPLHISHSGLGKVKSVLISMLGNVADESNLSVGALEGHIKPQKLDIAEEAVTEFFSDMGLLKDLNRMIASKFGQNFWIKLKGLGKIAHQYGVESSETMEAVQIAKTTLQQVEAALEEAYDDKFLLATINNPQHHNRRTRSADAKDTTLPGNISIRYDETYSSIFNIILWLSIFLIAALISVSVFICTLDPGRDSIIYRMTTQRIKKDN